ncbi:glycosyltransferase family 2 protein [Vibrio sp. 99-8-1]|uniref:glycosyltransferase family 2 protein n=1 Tax=Vibrio sp. 99-8-1 TaxID=2607602 RepID=UPI001493B01A|nr:glycosyltransferase family 2 protein [Vibrio sp. 99-8-1]NOI68633.1 glycosyltransferase family 2 protein [Vibrio sp. 99-8-1]
MKIFLSMVSHGHGELINELGLLNELSDDFVLIIKSNKEGDEFLNYIGFDNFHWIDEQYYSGFGRNNNLIFDYCKSYLNMESKDYFIVINPDVVVYSDMLNELLLIIKSLSPNLAAINLYKDELFKEYDNSIRKFPRLKDFVLSYFKLGNETLIDKSSIKKPVDVDWAAGSFLVFKSCHYSLLNGFNENYFMYCEDIDICYRSNKLGVPVVYLPNIKARHLGQHSNRKLFSRHFFWHISSMIRFLLSK